MSVLSIMKQNTAKSGLVKSAGKDRLPALVSLVGAGPGDAELLTIKALKRIQSCDLILIDNLVSDEIKALIPSTSKIVYVGKRMGKHCIPQDQLNQYMVDVAKQGTSICRLKGGDPFIFGRGSEELSVLLENNIPSEVIPGITAAAGCTSYAGIPLTHRGISTGCTFVTGHLQNSQLDLNWQELAGLSHTLVFYMGLSNLPEISKQLVKHGLNAATPAALIENGCRKAQRNFVGSVANLAEIAEVNGLQSPTLIVIGEVAALKDSLDWQAGLAQLQTYSVNELTA